MPRLIFDISDTSILLLIGIIATAVYLRYFSSPTPLVHPLLLSKQSDVSTTRKSNESAIYRNWAVGHGSPVSTRRVLLFFVVEPYLPLQLSTRPAGNVNVVADVLATESQSELTRFSLPVSLVWVGYPPRIKLEVVAVVPALAVLAQ